MADGQVDPLDPKFWLIDPDIRRKLDERVHYVIKQIFSNEEVVSEEETELDARTEAQVEAFMEAVLGPALSAWDRRMQTGIAGTLDREHGCGRDEGGEDPESDG
jgi:hypothetical protein